MASLLSPAPSGPPRLSQLLPTVKCSNCNEPVALSELGEHVCAPAPPLPKSPVSAKSVTGLLPTRLQNLVSSTRTSSPPEPPSKASPPGSAGQQRSSSLSVSGRNQRPERGPSPLSRTSESSASSPTSSLPSPSSSDPRASARIPPVRERAPSVSAHRAGTHSFIPGRAGTPPNAPQRVVSPSASVHAYPNDGGKPVDPRARTLSSPRREYPEFMSSPVIPPTRNNTPSAPLVQPPSRASNPSTIRRPSNGSAHYPFPSAAPPQIPLPRTPSTSSHIGTLPVHRHPSSSSTYTSPAPPPRTPPSPAPGSPKVDEPDTKTGGEAGMAGVGRRGFAAVARAAMFTTGHALPGQDNEWGTPSMDGRRPNAPRFLDINTASNVLNCKSESLIFAFAPYIISTSS
ncbi:hypothetical protein OE88DRAFT_951456 [Heliocybe sulcata]|uniref:Uncharacterized protein n=1 Tax=Heliocybe sulcata TaxID=5364 RepID=A0A5C3NAA9_9AGAM|nr:hypothetical protein OE88DRAFT_951456 [Heliocybe sulcata]